MEIQLGELAGRGQNSVVAHFQALSALGELLGDLLHSPFAFALVVFELRESRSESFQSLLALGELDFGSGRNLLGLFSLVIDTGELGFFGGQLFAEGRRGSLG